MKNCKLKNISLSFTFCLAFSALGAAAAPSDSCDQPERELSITTVHSIAGLTCHLHANNLTEKLPRTSDIRLNFVHQWNVKQTETTYEIEGICSTLVGNNSTQLQRPEVIYPGFTLRMKIPRWDDRCNPSYVGQLGEIPLENHNETSNFFEEVTTQAQHFIQKKNTRPVKVQFRDIPSNYVQSSYKGLRLLESVRVGTGVFSILRSGFTNASIQQGGYSSEPNRMGIGMSRTMSQSQFFHKQPGGLLIPQFSMIRGSFNMSKTLDPSFAARDILTISGFDREFYVRQNGATQIDDPKLSYENKFGTSAFFIRNFDINTKVAFMQGCTEYSYTGDYNEMGNLKSNECRSYIDSINR